MEPATDTVVRSCDCGPILAEYGSLLVAAGAVEGTVGDATVVTPGSAVIP